MPRKAVVTKSGDGGPLPPAVVRRLNDPIGAVEGGPPDARRANSRVVMNPSCPKARRVPTEDRVDRAHSKRDQDGLCIRGDHVDGATPRQYDPSYIVHGDDGRRYTVETAADWLYNARRRLAGIPGIGIGDDGSDDGARGIYDDRSAQMRARTREILERGRGGFRISKRA